MSNELKTIHEFDFTLICNYFKGLKRQGPGSPEVTQKALSFTNELSDEARIADIGCGTGGQTMALANYTKGQITGIMYRHYHCSTQLLPVRYVYGRVSVIFRPYASEYWVVLHK